MAVKDFLFTSESVSEGHPDKLCDQVSDAILDAHLAGDPNSRVACESLAKTGMVVVAGEITSNAKVSYVDIVREVVREIGYTDSAMGFDGHTCAILTAIEQQSPDISQGVTEGEGLHKEQGAGDQGMMFGYACDETPELMPFPIQMAHSLVHYLAKVRKGGEAYFLRPDSKSQVTVEYRDGKPVKVKNVVISTQHSPEVDHSKLKETIIDGVIKAVIPSEYLDKDTIFHGRDCIGAVAILDEQIFTSRDVQKSDARPGGYVATGGHGGIIGRIGHPGAPQFSFKPVKRHTYDSVVNLTRLPTQVPGSNVQGSRIGRVSIAIKNEYGDLLASAIPKVTIVKHELGGSFVPVELFQISDGLVCLSDLRHDYPENVSDTLAGISERVSNSL